MRRHHLYISLLLTLMISACYDDYEITGEELVTQEENIYHDGTLVGRAIDHKGELIPEAEIEYSGLQQTIGDQGEFIFDATRILHQGELLTITTNTNFSYLHTTFPTFNEVHYAVASCFTDIEYLESSTSDFNIRFANQTQLTSPAPVFKLDNNLYTGTIKLDGYLLNMLSDDEQFYFPQARTSDTELFFLDMKEGIHFYWTAEDGRRLTLEDGRQVSVSIPSSDTDQDVYIWHFNEETVAWDRKEIPELASGSYNFSISSDGYYCIAKAVPAIHVDGKVETGGKSIANAEIEIRNTAGTLLTKTRSSESGNWHTILPKEEPHIISVLGTCHEILKSVELMPLSATTTDIHIDLEDSFRFIGSAKSCQNKIVEETMLFIDDNYFLYLPEGTFDACMPVCPTTNSNLISYSPQTQEKSSTLNWRPTPHNNVQSLFICGEPKDNYVALRADDKMQYYQSTMTDIVSDSRIRILSSDDTNPDFVFDLKIPNQNIGSVSPSQLNIVFKDIGLGENGYSASCATSNSGCGFESFTINHQGSQTGDWICGTFSGKFWMSTINLNPNLAYNNRRIEGEFRVKRNF